MTAPKTRFPLSSFGPELMIALTKGGREGLTLKFKTRKMAHRFQIRCNTLRSRMRQEGHPDYQIASRAVVSLVFGEKIGRKDDPYGEREAHIIIRPRDSEFGEALKNAGVKLEDLTSDPLAESTSGETIPTFEEFLDNLGEEKTSEKGG